MMIPAFEVPINLSASHWADSRTVPRLAYRLPEVLSIGIGGASGCEPELVGVALAMPP